MTYEQALIWLRRNRKVLKLNLLADKAGVTRSTFVRVLTGVLNQHGKPYNIPEKYRKGVVEMVESILQTND